MSDDLRILGTVSVAFLAVALGVIPILWPFDTKHTFSQHIARKKSSILYYIVIFSIFLPCFLAFFIEWFIPHFKLPNTILTLVLIVTSTQYACTFIPETTGWKRHWHRVLAGSSAFALIPIVAYLACTLTGAASTAAWFSLLTMLVLPLIFLHPRFKIFGESFYIQAIYYTAFFIPILTAAYVA